MPEAPPCDGGELRGDKGCVVVVGGESKGNKRKKMLNFYSLLHLTLISVCMEVRSGEVEFVGV